MTSPTAIPSSNLINLTREYLAFAVINNGASIAVAAFKASLFAQEDPVKRIALV